MNVRYQLFLALLCLILNPVYSQGRQDGSDKKTEIPPFNFEVIKLQHTGPDANRVKLGYASDGYTTAELQDFPAHVENSVDYLTTPSQATRPLPRYKNFINIYRIDLISRESGISVAPRYNRGKTKTVANALGGTRDEDRLGWVDRQLAEALFNQAADRTGIKKINWPFVVLNNPDYHNSGGRFVVFSYNFGKEIGLHEAGHGFFNLADEYYGDGTFEGDEPRNINVTADPDAKKWSHWIGYADKDTLLGTIGVYEGAIYTSRGAYRPSKNNKMG